MFKQTNGDYTETSSDDESQNKYKKGTAAWTNNKMSSEIVPRPNASSGYWLCCLLPLAFCTHYLHDSSELDCTSTYKILTVAAVGMCVESLCFFAYLHIDSWLFLKVFISLLPSLLASVLFKYALSLTWGYGLLYGFLITFCYQNMYVRIMRNLPKCFTYGEAAILIQGLMLFVLNILIKLSDIAFNDVTMKDDFTQLNVIMMSALFFLLLSCGLLALFTVLRQPLGFYCLMTALLIAITCAPVTKPLPVLALLEFLFRTTSRLIFVLFSFALVFVTIGIVHWKLRYAEKASTRVRKIFHALIVLVFIPGMIFDCDFLYIATGVALAIFTVLELFRILNMPPLGVPLESAFASFSDEKDAGILALTPFSLLIGCSLPIWLHTCPCNNTDEVSISLLAGVLSTGIGDAAASIIGSKFGRIKWHNSMRSFEGSAAFVLSILIISFVLAFSGFISMTTSRWFSTLVASLITALVEAQTDQIDNLVLPLVFYSIVNLI